MNDPLLHRTAELAAGFLAGVDDRHVGPNPPRDDLLAALGGPMPTHGEPALDVIESLARGADPGLVASVGGRYFGFVIGGSHPAGLAADWLVSAWDQNVGFNVLSPAAAAIEQITAGWVLDLLDLPADATAGFVTGCQMANFMALAAARQSVLDRAGWDVSSKGLIGAPPIRVITSAQIHGTIDRALAMLGLGADSPQRIGCDDQGRVLADEAVAAIRASDQPTIVCAQAGNVDTGSFDPFGPIAEACRERGAWLHIDGAFGLWAAAHPTLRELTAGANLADSWATDAHKWLNVPYDAGVVIVRDRASLLAATNYRGDYLVRSGEHDDPCSHTPESSRRARAIPIYATLRELGREGVAELVDRCCRCARRAAESLRAGGATIHNDVVLNQVLFSFEAPAGADHDAHTNAVIDAIQRDGTCWLGGTSLAGRRAIRLSVCGWKTTEDDIDRSVEAILRCARATSSSGR